MTPKEIYDTKPWYLQFVASTCFREGKFRSDGWMDCNGSGGIIDHPDCNLEYVCECLGAYLICPKFDEAVTNWSKVTKKWSRIRHELHLAYEVEPWVIDFRHDLGKETNPAMTYKPDEQPFEPQWSYPSITYHHYVGHHSMFLIVAYDLETNQIKFLDMKGGKPDPCETAYREAVTRLAIIAFDNGATIDEVADSLQGITCVPESNNELKGFIHSPADYLAKCLILTQEKMAQLKDQTP